MVPEVVEMFQFTRTHTHIMLESMVTDGPKALRTTYIKPITTSAKVLTRDTKQVVPRIMSRHHDTAIRNKTVTVLYTLSIMNTICELKIESKCVENKYKINLI